MEKVTVEGLDALCAELARLETEKEFIEKTLKDLNKVINQLEYRGAAYLKDLGREDYASPAGKISIVTDMRVKMPDNEMDRMALFDHLKERGIFEAYISIHAGRLNALYKADMRNSEDPMLFSMPGMAPPKIEDHPVFKPNKKAKI